jgi:hypothetical protein
VIQRCPQNAHNGFFYKLQYQPEPYSEIAEQYTKTQPLNKRKLGFGSHDACKTGEFTSTKATERYRDVVRNEAKLLDRHRNTVTEKEAIEQFEKQDKMPPRDKFGNDLHVSQFLYDIGRTHIQYNPRSTHDSFYSLPKHAPVNPKLKGQDGLRRLGFFKPMSATYGEKAWTHKYGKPEYGQVSYVEKFYDRGHYECKGF